MNDNQKRPRRLLLAALGLVSVMGAVAVAPVSAEPMVEKLHFLVPGGAGGGWDGTARGTGEALTKAGLLGSASYQNMSGGGGGKAIGWLISNAARSNEVLMVNSTPIVVRSITKVFPYSFRDLTPIAGTIGDYGVLCVRADSPFKNFGDVVAAFKADPRSVKVAGGSVRGDLDHLVAASAFQAAGQEAGKVVYIPYDAGGKAMAGFLSGETELLSTGFGEVVEQHKAGQLRIIGVTSPAAVDGIASFKEQGVDFEFANWRGFFGPPGLPAEKAKLYADMLGAMYETPAWETVRSRNGWANIYRPGAEFVSFLERQEQEVRDLRRTLGFSD